MTCFCPKQAFWDAKNGCITWSRRKAALWIHPLYKKWVPIIKLIPCGVCEGCLLDRSKSWAARCTCEAHFHKRNCFITLTYAEEHLPSNGSLDFDHLTKFYKDCRNRGIKFRYFSCGEYGDEYQRPHFHVNMFGFDFFDDAYRIWDSPTGHPQFVSPTLESIWKRGFCPFTYFDFKNAAYSARYVLKKAFGAAAKTVYEDLEPEKVRMSLKPGLGKLYFEKYKDLIYSNDFIMYQPGKKIKPPRYFDKLLEATDPVLFEKVKKKRLLYFQTADKSNYTPERLRERQIYIQEIIKTKLKRSYESV